MRRIESTKKNGRYRGTKESFKEMTNEQENFHDIKNIKLELKKIEKEKEHVEKYMLEGINKTASAGYLTVTDREIKIKPEEKYILLESEIVGIEIKNVILKDENKVAIEETRWDFKDFMIEITDDEFGESKVFVSYEIKYRNFSSIGKEELLKKNLKMKQKIKSLKERCLMYELSFI
jgi:hypothetical protein